MTPLTPAELNALDALLEKATPGPWFENGEICYEKVSRSANGEPYQDYDRVTYEQQFSPNDRAALIALRNAAPALIACAEAAKSTDQP